MKIAKLTIHNFLKLKDVEMNPSKTNVIVGKNKQGKTSILKAIRAVFTGDADATSIHMGGDKAEILVEMTDLDKTYNVKRTLTQKGNYLDISNKEGMKMPAPQKFLDGILGTFSFNPIEFFDKKATDRKKYLLNAIKITITQDELAEYTGEKLTGLDYDAHALEVVEQARKYYYDKRTIANSEMTKKEKALMELSQTIPTDFDPKSVSEENISKLRDAIQKDKAEKAKYEAHQKHIGTLVNLESDIKGQIEALQKRLIGVQDEIIAGNEMKFDFSDDTSMAAFEETLAKMEGQRELLYTVKKSAELRAELDTTMKEAENLDVVVKKLTKEVPEDLIKKAKLPVEGLTIIDSDIFINGVNIDNLSSSEQLKFGLQIARALNEEFGIICIDGVESLDKETFAEFLKEVENDDNQYFVSRVDGDTIEKNGHSIIEIEDGNIKPPAAE
jgi:recombinational DNA repair ATPase RecF